MGQAATKLQELLKVTQDQLAKERETVKKLKEQLHEKVLVPSTGTDGPAVAVGHPFCHWWRLQECVSCGDLKWDAVGILLPETIWLALGSAWGCGGWWSPFSLPTKGDVAHLLYPTARIRLGPS